jgi:putative ABC transport system substrate-binding protein
MRRREFVTLLGGAAAVSAMYRPSAARAQPRERMRRIGVMHSLAADDPEIPGRITALAQALQALGWTVGRNLQIDYRWTAGDPERLRRFSGELVALGSDVIVAQGGSRSQSCSFTPLIRSAAGWLQALRGREGTLRDLPSSNME